MLIYVINGRKFIKTARIIAIILVVTTVCTVFLNVFGRRAAATNADANTGTVIIIDAGHGGEDSGAIGINGVYEKDLNLAIAVMMADELRNMGYTVVLTRTEDKMLYLPEENIKGMRKISDLKNRCKLAEEYPDCIFVSVHMNSYGSSKYSGLQTYYSDGKEESRRLADKIQSSVRKTLQPDNKRQIKNGKSLYLLENAKGTAVIVECGFLSNGDECEKLSQKEYQKELSFSIIYGIIEYINEKDSD